MHENFSFLFLAIELTKFPKRPSPTNKKIESVPITDGFRNCIPKISYKRNPTGITLLWQKKPDPIIDLIKNYRIILDNEPYENLLEPDHEPKVQINLSSGKHECYLEVILKDNDQEIFKSNILKFDYTPPPSDQRLYESKKQQKEPTEDTSVYTILEQQDAPIPKLSLQTISPSSIRLTWYLDRAIPTNAFVAMYDVHVRGEVFPEQMTSDEHSEKDGYIEHIWHVPNSPLEITGISERQEYTIHVRALFHGQGSNDTKYVITTSNKVTTTRVDPLIDLLSRPMLKVTRIGLQMANLSWNLEDSVDQTLVKGYRIFINSKPTEILSPNQTEYELRNLKPGTSNEIQVSVTSHRDFVDEKISEPIRILCPQRPQPPTIQTIKADKPFSIGIKWKLDDKDQDEITSFKTFLDGKLHGEIETHGRQSFKYDFNKLQPDQTYSIYVKSVIGQKKLDGYVYQCDIESNASNELVLKCATPPKGTALRIERVHTNGVDVAWDAPIEYGDVKLTGYQILKNGRAVGNPLPIDKRQATIHDLDLGNRYSLQVVPITDQPGGTLFRSGEEYDPDRHGHYIPGPKLEVEYTDLIPLPAKFWVENVSGHSAMICWSPIDESSSSNIQPDGYKLSIWNNKELPREKAKTIKITKDKNQVHLKELQSETIYEIQLEVYKKRRYQATEDSYLVSTKSEIITFETGSPPDAPSSLHVIACTNTDVRIGFDQFIEHKAEIKAIRVQCEPISTELNTREIIDILTPDATECTLTNLLQRTDYNVTIYGITDEYLNENRYRDISQLPKKLKSSKWLPNQSLKFQTSGYESASQIIIHQATMDSIELEWKLPKVYGSTQCIGQILRWKLEHGEEHTMELNQNTSKATIPGPLLSGVYKISIDSKFSIKISLEDDSNEASRKEIHTTTTESVTIRFRTPAACERPEIYVTGYTTDTIDLSWNKPDMFNIIDHPEKMNEQLKIHGQLIAYKIYVNGQKQHTLDENHNQCILTECKPGEEYNVQLIAQTAIQNEYMNGLENNDESAETASKKLAIRMLKTQDLLRSFQANFEFNPIEQENQMKSLGKLNIKWTVSDTKNISHFNLQWHSSKDLSLQQKIVASNETSFTIDPVDEKHHYVIKLTIVTNTGDTYEYEQLTIPIPGEPDPPKLWLAKTTDTSFIIEWSEPKSYGIPIIGYQLYIAGKKSGDIIQVNSRHVEIRSRINRTYQVNVCAVTNNPQRTHSMKSQTLSVITAPTTDLIPTMYYNNEDGNSTTFDRTIARIIPLQIDTINEDKLHLDWTSFLSTSTIKSYYIHYTCLNNGEVQTTKVSKRFRHTVLRGLRPGFTYGIMVMAVDKNGGVLYTSDKTTIQMNAPPNAPIVSISERTTNHVKLEWRPAPSYGEIAVVGYKIYVNDRLAVILTHDQLTYTLTNGRPCEKYTVHVQALSNDKNIVSPMSRAVHFAWPGIKAGAFKRIDDGQAGYIIVAWEHPQLEDETEKLIGFKLFSENMLTHAVRLHGEYDAATHQATIYDLNYGKYLFWLEIKSEKFCVRSRTIQITTSRLNSSANRQISFDSLKYVNKKSQRFRSPLASTTTPPLRHIQYS